MKSFWASFSRIIIAGGLADPSNINGTGKLLIQDINDLFDKLREHLLKDGFLESESDLDLLYIQNDGISAFVTHDTISGRKAICLHIGLIKAVWNLLILSLCDPLIIEKYPGDEKITYRVPRSITIAQLTNTFTTPSKEFNQTIHSTANKRIVQNITQERLELCDTLFCCLFDYVLYHEAMHITRGHLVMSHIIDNQNFLSETASLNNKSARIYQLLEIDADMVSLSYNLDTHPEMVQHDKLSDFEKKDFYFTYIFSHILLQQLFDIGNQTIKQQLVGNHPPPVIRSMLWSNLTRQQYIARNILDQDTITDQQNKAWWEASLVAQKLGFSEGRWHGSHMNDLPMYELSSYIDEYNEFSDAIDQDLDNEEYKGFLDLIKRMKD